MRVAEIFYTLQGEGINVGVPAVFLRLAGCHLRCSWCDSKFTWDMNSGREMSIEQILRTIKKYKCKHLVITGGEPLIQQNALIKLLKKIPDCYIEIETSGSLPTHLNEYIDHYNCSPKLGNSENRYHSRLEKFPAGKTYYKFVVDKPEDLREIKSFIKKHSINRNQVQLMPQGTGKRELAEKSLWLAELCKKENFRFSPRLHIELWGNKRKT